MGRHALRPRPRSRAGAVLLLLAAVVAVVVVAALWRPWQGAPTAAPEDVPTPAPPTPAEPSPDPSPTPERLPDARFTIVGGGDVLPHATVIRTAATGDGYDFVPLMEATAA